MALGYDRMLYIVAFDHRGSFQKQLFGIGGEPSVIQANRFRDDAGRIGEYEVVVARDGARSKRP
jgi:hypothetical protein